MLSNNPAFIGCVNATRNRFIELLHRAKVGDFVYPSKYFFERVVERNLDEVDVLRMITPVIKEYRETTYNERTYLVSWKQHAIACSIQLGTVSEKRQIILRTLYEKYNEMDYDVCIRL